jgi:hypothetical protein
MSHDYENASRQEIQEQNETASMFAALGGYEPFHADEDRIEEWRDSLAEDIFPEPPGFPHVGYHEPMGWERVGEPVKVSMGPNYDFDDAPEGAMSIREFFNSLEPGFYTIGEMRDATLDIQEWEPEDPTAVRDLDEVELDGMGLADIGALLAESLGIDGSVDPCEDCPGADECSEEQKADMRARAGYTD